MIHFISFSKICVCVLSSKRQSQLTERRPKHFGTPSVGHAGICNDGYYRDSRAMPMLVCYARRLESKQEEKRRKNSAKMQPRKNNKSAHCMLLGYHRLVIINRELFNRRKVSHLYLFFFTL